MKIKWDDAHKWLCAWHMGHCPVLLALRRRRNLDQGCDGKPRGDWGPIGGTTGDLLGVGIGKTS